jgi:adenosylcobinamide kinase/adenosylcobinamide-phosphate guanylyltransferase
MGLTELVLGGARSGKSELAERLAAQRPPVIYVATAEPRDPEMAGRILAHRRRRPPEWRTIEVPRAIVPIIRQHGAGTGTILIECATLWVSNVLCSEPRADPNQVLAEADDWIEATRQAEAHVVCVSSEVGAGIVPDNPTARQFRDILGEVNQRLARAADHVYFCVAGLSMQIK